MSRPHLNRRQLLGGAAALGLVDALRGGTLAQWMSSDAHAQTTPRAPAPTRRWQNWSGLQQATPATWAAPAHEAELQQLLRRTRGEVRAVGAGHSFTALVPTDQTLVSLDRLHGIVSIDRAAMTVTAHAGTRIGALAKALDAQGLALRNQPDVDVQTLAGAIATGTHGTGAALPALHDEVARQEGLHPDADSWTLTWLEGRPRCALDDLVIVTLDAEGRPALISASSEHSIPGTDPDDDDDDDDWLS